jgi:YbbR domain-containing protein
MLRDLLFKNLGWKMLSLLLAASIWLTVKTVSNESATAREARFPRLPIRVVSSAGNVHAFKLEPEYAAVTIRSRPETIERLTAAEIHVVVDLTGADLDRDSHRRIEVSVPPGVTVVNVEPADAVVLVPSRNLLKFPNNP